MITPDQVKKSVQSFTIKQKIIAGAGGGMLLFLASMLCCSGSTWFFAADYGARREKERAEGERERIIKEAQEKMAKIFTAPVDNQLTPPAAIDWLTPDKAAIVDGIRVELIEGKIGKVQTKSFASNNTYSSAKSFFQVRLRVTNNAENFVLQYTSWGSSRGIDGVKLVDEFNNVYHHGYFQSTELVGGVSFERVDPGKSVEDLLAFEMPLATSKEFRLELSGIPLRKTNVKIAYKLPRSFFEK